MNNLTPSEEKTAEERAGYKTINRTSLAPIERAELLTFGYLTDRGLPGGLEFARATSVQILAETIKEYDSLRLTNQRLEAEVEEWKGRYVQYSKTVVGVEKLLREDIEEKFNRIKELEAEVERMKAEEKRQAYIWFKRGYLPQGAIADERCVESFEKTWQHELRLRDLESQNDKAQ